VKCDLKHTTNIKKCRLGLTATGVVNLIFVVKFHHKSTDRKILMFKTYLLKHVRTYFLLTLLKHNALVLCVIHIMMLFLQSVIRTDLRMLGQLMVSRFMVLVSNSLVLVLRHVGLPHITD